MSTIDFFNRRLPSYLSELRELVSIETPTGHTAGAEQAAEWLSERLSPFGELDLTPTPGYGPMLRFRRPGSSHKIMLIGHLDTVWPVGSWPVLWREENGHIHGPGIYDMKGGLLFIIELLRWLDATGVDHPSLEILINPDEEIGSIVSAGAIHETARGNDLVFVLEPSTKDGVIKLARKGSGEFALTIHGRSAHQGVEPEKGINAVVEAAHQIGRLLELQDLELGTTIGPNVLRAGDASNVVPDHAKLVIDVRAWTSEEQQRINEGLAALEPVLDGATLELSGSWNRPPMETSETAMAVFERAREIGDRLDLDLQWVRWGGSSDANLTAAAGTPTVDGLGPVGRGSHHKSESIVVEAIPARLALFAELVASLTEPV